MGTWNRRKKYSIEGDGSDNKQPKVKLQLNKLIKRELYLTMLSIAAVTLIIIGSTYAVFSSVNKSKDYNVINVGTLQISYEDTGTGLGDIIKLNNAFPVSDSVGKSTTGYKFKITNTGSLASSYSVRIADDQAMIDADGCASNLLSKSALKYSLNSGTPTILASKVNYEIDAGELKPGASKTYDLKMWINETSGNEVLGKHFHGKIVVVGEATESAAKDIILANNTVQTTNPNFGSISSGVGLYQSPDDDGTSYYFRGSSVNNWVSFAGYYWRIVRINGDGTIRLVYNGTSTSATNSSLVIPDYYYTSNQSESVLGATEMISRIEDWYDSAIGRFSYDSYVVTGKFCVDSSVASVSGDITYFKSRARLTLSPPVPTLKCETPTKPYGGKVNTKSGTFTADEIIMSTSVITNGMSSVKAWTMTPYTFDGSTDQYISYNAAQMWYVNGGTLSSVSFVAPDTYLRPVINLRANVTLTGSGTTSSPYLVS